MMQNILALSIVFAALAYVVFSLFRKRKAEHQSTCDSCSGCSGCELKKSIIDKSRNKALGCH